LIPCEGSGAPGHKVLSGFAATFAEECGGKLEWGPGMVMCRCCGSVVGDAGSGDTVEHDRADLIAMIVRGDFG
jgi:hypothetical protein